MKRTLLRRQPPIYQNPHLQAFYWQELCGEPAFAPPAKKTRDKTLHRRGRFKSALAYAFFVALLFCVFSLLLTQSAWAAEDLTLVAITTQPDGSQTQQEYPVNNSFGKDQKEQADQPLLPAKLLSDICGVPISWHSTGYGGALVWGRQEVAAVLLAGNPHVYAVIGGGTEEARVYEYDETDGPVLINGSVYVPLSILPYLGIDYTLDPANNTIYLNLTSAGFNVVTPEKIWPLVEPQATAYLKPKNVLLATATTSYDASQVNRSQNLLLATTAIHGTVLKPGQSFSFNRVVGERTTQKGYKVAIIYAGKQKVPGIGGGICQVSTTVYQSARKAGLKITERHTHSLPVSYANSSNDATVAWGYLDLKFANNTKENLYFVNKMKGGKLTVEIWQGELPKNLPNVYGIAGSD